MESYVRMFDTHARPTGENPAIGLILCSKKNEVEVFPVPQTNFCEIRGIRG